MQQQEQTWFTDIADGFKACVEDIWSLEVNTCVVSQIGGYKFNPISCYENIYNIPIDLQAFRQALLPDDYEARRLTEDPEKIKELKNSIQEKFHNLDHLPTYIVGVFRKKLLGDQFESNLESSEQMEGLEPLDHLETTMKSYILIRDRLLRAYRSSEKLKQIRGQSQDGVTPQQSPNKTDGESQQETTKTDGDLLPDINTALAKGLLDERLILRELRSLREIYYLVGGKDAADSTNINDLISAQTIIQMDGDVMNRFHKALFNEPEKDFLVKTHQAALISGQENWRSMVNLIIQSIQTLISFK
jgi:hypothetical protein